MRYTLSMAKSSQTALRIPDHLRAALERAAADDERPMSYIMLKALEAWLAERGYIEKPAKPPRPKAKVAASSRPPAQPRSKAASIALPPSLHAAQRWA
jgi:hypothetical protein